MNAGWSVSPLQAALHCRCPRCGKGRLYGGYLEVADRCESCGLDLKKADSGDGPAVFLILGLGALFVPLALWVDAVWAPSKWVHMAIWVPTVLGTTLLLIRPLKAYFIALQYRHRASDSGTEDYDKDE
ncbi:Uncharacterized conserved protein, DUF983 family [Tistlia consotensis]|uniref:Uncharacterized conserved protein, DUF983 family n=1 Tax=Tistlia consotensis USBA 355 TaxID=560819 RepID=A0A1Y6BBE7_9PROT|nr:DUF983 domain-containing protein [Tistlia consotensis]SME94664.1 Uncharacterized conserved protein, DUF983 family [Tistlia consotensis USBA 355]SNR29471.1 Uncharacterized conserved protein, DUF983 family [Tistlia consotensis]